MTAPLSLSHAKKIVIKVGSALVVNTQTGRLQKEWMQSLAEDIALLSRRGVHIILVSSGAIALARTQLNLKNGPLRLDEKQAAASIGQIGLAQGWSKALAPFNLTAGQLLLTLEDTEARNRYLNARNTLNMLHKLGCVPIINENDATATTEIRFGDNDRLAAKVAVMTDADQLIILSDIDGLYTANPDKDPSAQHIPLIPTITEDIEAMAGEPTNIFSSGGMKTKIIAAKIATHAGCAVAIAKGTLMRPLHHLIEGNGRCSWFLPQQDRISARKNWIASSLKSNGELVIDQGAVQALLAGHSLLPAGIVSMNGYFSQGDLVVVKDSHNRLIAKGLISYDADDAQKIMGHHTHEIEQLLGWLGREEMIHRDNLVLLC
ncbi:glutamate 5-kinase [Entomobacter blattae]|uniref:Glutamate 5-kinase n=1 Tax=Entomobacter blattae TaxID=2762277 RepID=A0A7H1NNQ4_9PROT|nr:glutamate 5-kinase [Entomobacter blattae]QNT77414.1 Glutamate 5-kinase [Entomobacter blattae]